MPLGKMADGGGSNSNQYPSIPTAMSQDSSPARGKPASGKALRYFKPMEGLIFVNSFSWRQNTRILAFQSFIYPYLELVITISIDY